MIADGKRKVLKDGAEFNLTPLLISNDLIKAVYFFYAYFSTS